MIQFHGNLYTKHSNTLILDHPFNGGSNYFRLVLSHVYYKTVICQSFLDNKEAVDKETLSPHSQMIRKDNLIKGIIIGNKEFKLSQYADDTQIFLDGSEISLKKTLDKLKLFYSMSGLKINVEKTRAIWIGSMNRSNRKLCLEYNLDWKQEPFKILGVTFTPEVFDIWDQNATDVLKNGKYYQVLVKKKHYLAWKDNCD